MSNFFDTAMKWIELKGIKLLIALLVLIVSFRIITLIFRHLQKKAEKSNKLDKTVAKAVAYIGGIAAKCLIVIALVAYLGIDTSALTALVASVGVCAGLAINGALSNFAGGVMILITRPFKVDDYIKVGEYEGTVKDIFIINTKIVTLDNRVVYLPNGVVSTSPIVNYTTEGKRRIDHLIAISYGDDYKKAEEILMGIMENHPMVLKDPAPSARMTEHGDSGIILTCRPWVKPENYWDVYWDVLESAKTELEAAGMTIPFNQVDVHIHNS